MKSINEIINENKEEQINEAFDGFSVFACQMTFLILTNGLFVKSFKEVLNGENGIIEVANILLKDTKVNRICKKLAKDPEIRKILSGTENIKKDAFETAVKSKLAEKEYQYLYDITREKVQEHINKK